MINCLVYTEHSLNMEEERDISQSREHNWEDKKTKEIEALRRCIYWIDNEIKWKSERKTINGWKKYKLKLKERLHILVTVKGDQ